MQKRTALRGSRSGRGCTMAAEKDRKGLTGRRAENRIRFKKSNGRAMKGSRKSLGQILSVFRRRSCHLCMRRI